MIQMKKGHLNSPIRITQPEDNNLPIAYDEFGEMSAVPSIDQPFGFTGYQIDSVSGLHYAQARYYSSDMGRFTGEDPIRDKLNWYAYCSGNPMHRIDPSGLQDYAGGGGTPSGNNAPGFDWEAFLERYMAGDIYAWPAVNTSLGINQGVIVVGRESAAYAGILINVSDGLAFGSGGLTSMQSSATGITPGAGLSTGHFIGFFPTLPNVDNLADDGFEAGGAISIPIPIMPKLDLYLGLERATVFVGDQSFHGLLIISGFELDGPMPPPFDVVNLHAQSSFTEMSRNPFDIARTIYVILRPAGVAYQGGRLVVVLFREPEDCDN